MKFNFACGANYLHQALRRAILYLCGVWRAKSEQAWHI